MSEVEGVSRKWSASRIGAASLLVAIVLAAIAFGIYSLVNSGNGNKQTANNNTHLTAPMPQKSSKTKSTGNNSSSNHGLASVGSNGASAAKSANPSSGNSSLTNTGPGDTALTAFIAVSIIAMIAHYGWRRLHSARS